MNFTRGLSKLQNKRFRESTVQGPPDRPKEPVMSFALSTPSFLACTITEIGTNWPLYQITSSNTTTTIKRKESDSTSVVAASIKWPKIIPMSRRKGHSESVTVLVRNVQWQDAGSLLKPGSKESSGKFQFPELHNPLMWKLDGDQYKCTTSSSSFPIATLRPWRGKHRIKLIVYEDPYGHRPRQSVYGGISTLFLDHLLVSALLLVTDLQEWARVSNSLESSSDSEPESTTDTPQSWEEVPSPFTVRQTSLDSSASTPPTIPTATPFKNLAPVQTGTLLRHCQPLHSWLNTDTDSGSDQLSPVSDLSPAIESNHSHMFYPSPSPIGEPSHATLNFPPSEKLAQLAQGSTTKASYPLERSRRPLPPTPAENGVGMPLSGLGRPGQRYTPHTSMADHVYPRFLDGPSQPQSPRHPNFQPSFQQPITGQNITEWSRGDIQELLHSPLMLESPPPSYQSHMFASERE